MTKKRFEELNNGHLYYEDLEEELSEKELDEYREKLYDQPYYKDFEEVMEAIGKIPDYCDCDTYEIEKKVYMHYNIPIGF